MERELARGERGVRFVMVALVFLFDRRGVGSTVSRWRWRVEFERLVRDGNSWCFVGKSAAGSAHLAMAMSACMARRRALAYTDTRRFHTTLNCDLNFDANGLFRQLV